jgi:hypothetical protein
MRSYVIRMLGLAVSVAVVVAVVAVIGLGGAGTKGGHRSAHAAPSAKAERRMAHPTSGLSPDELRALAFDVAKRNGDGAPSSIEAVKTTHREAWRLMFPGTPWCSGAPGGDHVRSSRAGGCQPGRFHLCLRGLPTSGSVDRSPPMGTEARESWA